MIIKNQYSSNFSRKSRKSKDIKFIIIHYTGMQSKIVSIKRLLDPRHKVSCHYLIDRKGEVLKMVDENKIAWHAGKSKWKKYINLNKNSIGIELVNRGHRYGYQSFSKIQISQLINLCKILKKKFKIKSSFILGHSDIAPLRKIDPGEKFPWVKLSRKRIGIKIPKIKKKREIKTKNLSRKIFFKNLHKIGYRYFSLTKILRTDKSVIKAFQRRFLQNNVNGKIDQKTFNLSHLLSVNYKN